MEEQAKKQKTQMVLISQIQEKAPLIHDFPRPPREPTAPLPCCCFASCYYLVEPQELILKDCCIPCFPELPAGKRDESWELKPWMGIPSGGLRLWIASIDAVFMESRPIFSQNCLAMVHPPIMCSGVSSASLQTSHVASRRTCLLSRLVLHWIFLWVSNHMNIWTRGGAWFCQTKTALSSGCCPRAFSRRYKVPVSKAPSLVKGVTLLSGSADSCIEDRIWSISEAQRQLAVIGVAPETVVGIVGELVWPWCPCCCNGWLKAASNISVRWYSLGISRRILRSCSSSL